MTQGRDSNGATINRSRTRRAVPGGLAIGGAILVVVATFLPWYQWSAGGFKVTRFGPNLYELGSIARWNSVAPVFVIAGVVLLLLSGLLVLLGREDLLRPTTVGMSIGVLAVIVGSVTIQSPRAFDESHQLLGLLASVTVQRGPGLFVALAGAALGAASLVLLLVSPHRREIHNAEPSSGVRAPVPS